MKGRHQRTGFEFEKELREIQSLRMSGVDIGLSRPTSLERLENALVKEPEWKMIKNKLINAPRKEQTR